MSERKSSPFKTLFDTDVATLIQAADDVYQIRFKNRAANAYLVRGSKRTILIDVGLSTNYPSLVACLDHLGVTPEMIDMVVLSHEHLDHIGAAWHFHGRAYIAAHRLAANKIMLRDDFSMLRKMFNEPNVPIDIDIWLEEGNLIDLGNFRLNVMYTPGHTSACITLFEQDKGLLFAADTLMPGGVMGGVFGSGSIADYIQSLERLKGLSSKILLSGHGRLSDTPQDDVRMRCNARTGCSRTPRSCSTRSMRARTSSRSCSRCATSTSSTIDARLRVSHRATIQVPPSLAASHITAFDKSIRGLFNRSNNKARRQGARTMKLYDSIGPNPRIVRMFMAEKGIEIPKQTVDLRKGENREDAHLKRNPHGQMPALELDSGNYLSEITAICEYLEEKHPSPAMIGATPEERAECRMWTRRVDLNIAEPLANGYRFGEALKFFEKRIPVAPEASPGLKMIAANRIKWLDDQMADGRKYICDERFTLADMLLYCWIDFGNQVGQPLNQSNGNIVAWFNRVGERPSVKA